MTSSKTFLKNDLGLKEMQLTNIGHAEEKLDIAMKNFDKNMKKISFLTDQLLA